MTNYNNEQAETFTEAELNELLNPTEETRVEVQESKEEKETVSRF